MGKMHGQWPLTLLLLTLALPTDASSSRLLRLRGGRDCVELKNIPTARWFSLKTRPIQDAIPLNVPVQASARLRKHKSTPPLFPAMPCPPKDDAEDDAQKSVSSSTSRAPFASLLAFVGSL